MGDAFGAERPREAALALAWESQWFRCSVLTSTDGKSVRVVYPGSYHGGPGPDFRDALVEIDGVLVRGDVEVHLRSSSWKAHGHHLDERYRNVVLHVVLTDDDSGFRACSSMVTLCVAAHLRGPLHALEPDSGRRICGGCGCSLIPIDIDDRVRSLAHARFQRKAALLEAEASTWGWDQTLWAACLESLGYTSNRVGFRALSRAVPWSWVVSEMTDPSRLEALVMGVAGWIGQASPEAVQAWPEVSRFWDVAPLPPSLWCSWGWRPGGAPWKRLLAFVRLLVGFGGWHFRERMQSMLVQGQPAEVGRKFISLLAGGANPCLGRTRIVELLANVLLPSLPENLDGKLWEVWCELPCEGYGVTRRLERQLGLVGGPQKMYWVQGLLELRARYCVEGRVGLCPLKHWSSGGSIGASA